jgi:hypothetical protein
MMESLATLAALAAEKEDTMAGKIFVVGAMLFLFGGLGIWSLRLAFKPPVKLGVMLWEISLAALCFLAVFLTIKAVF